MKKFSTLLLSSLFSLSLLAYDGSRLSISTVSNNMDIKIEIDGRRFAMQDNSVTISNLREGYHQVKIYRESKRSGGIFGFGKRQDVLYSNSIFLKRGFHSDLTVNRFGKVFVDEHYIDRNDEWYDDKDDNEYHGNGNDDGGWNNGHGNGNNDGGWNNGYGNVMNSREFEMVKDQIRKEWFENNRLTSVKTIIDKNNFTTQQVKELMFLFTFENNRLEVAKYAYRKTTDKNNYYQVNDALTFGSNKEELARFIRESR